jgi:CheY-like chemotaxis protein
MTTPPVGLALSDPAPSAVKTKRVLLVDVSPAKRELRAKTMRDLGVDVDCAADISEARAWWRAGLYHLVLINMGSEPDHRDKFCEDIRNATPPQQLAFLVGKPDYLADSPDANGTVPVQQEDNPADGTEVKAASSAEVFTGVAQHWGILEASRRISAVRTLAHVRTKAIREKPTPPRDLETRYAKRTADESRTLDELLREEMQ